MFGRAKRKRRERAREILRALADGQLCGEIVLLFGVCTQPAKHHGPCVDNREWTTSYIEFGTRT